MATIELRTAQEALVEARLGSDKEVRVTIATASMSPFLQVGDRIVVRGTQPQNLKFGDIVLWRARQGFLAHRFIGRHVERGNILITTKGDNCVQADEPGQAVDLLGVAAAIQYGAGEVSLRSSWARWASRGIASLSRLEWFIKQKEDNFPRAIALKLLRIGVRGSGMLARKVAGFGAKQQKDTSVVPSGR